MTLHTTATDWLKLVRWKHWLKNSFLVAPALFSEHFSDGSTIALALLAFVCFCPLASGIYLINDVVDRRSDAAHPRKRHRPVASGRIGAIPALIAGLGLLGAAFVLAGLTLPRSVAGFMLAYLLNSLLYTAWLKNRVIVDVLLIAAGFVLRLLAGCAAIGVEPTSWLIVCGFTLALVLGFGKRRAEVQAMEVTRNYRPALISYDIPKLNTLLGVCSAVCLMGYTLYTIAPETVALHGTKNLLYTVPIVAYGLFRYLFKSMEGAGDGPTEILIADKVFAMTGLLWGTAVLAAITWK